MNRHATAEQLSALLDVELSEHELAEIEGHLESCSECGERLAGMRRVVDRLRGLERAAPPATLAAEVVQRAATLPRAGSPLAHLERFLANLPLQSSLVTTFALVVGLAVGLYFYAHLLALERRPGTTLIVQPPSRPPAVEPLIGESAAAAPSGQPAAPASPPAKPEAAAPPAKQVSEPPPALPAAPPAAAEGQVRQRAFLREELRTAESVPKAPARHDEKLLAASGGRVRAAGRWLVQRADGWWEAGLETISPDQEVSADSEAGRALLVRYPDLEPLLAPGGRVVLKVEGKVLALQR